MKKLFFSSVSLSFLFLNAKSQSLDEKAGTFFVRATNSMLLSQFWLLIFAGLIVFLIFQERKISKLEQQLKDKNS